MKCSLCGKEMKNTIGGNYQCDCGFAINDLVNRQQSEGIQPQLFGFNYGWICPKCGAVMSPTTITCVCCSPNQPLFPQIT